MKYDTPDEMDNPPVTEPLYHLIYVLKKKITGKLSEENTGINTCDFGLDKAFLYMTPKAQVTKKR